MRRGAVALVGVLASLALGQEAPEPRFRIDLDPQGLAREVDRAVALLDSDAEEGLALVERLERDPALREGYVERNDGFTSLDQVLRRKLQNLNDEAQRAYDARHEGDVTRLEQQGTRAALERLLALHPGSSHGGRAALRLADLELEAGEVEAAAHHLEAAAASRFLEARDLQRAQIALPAAYALSGRRQACADALARLDGDRETAARRLAARAADEREASRAEFALVTTALATFSWSYRSPDWFDDVRGGPGAVSEPVADASCVYVHDGSRCAALDLATGKLLWRAPLREQDTYHTPSGRCRLSVGASTVLCTLPTGELVSLSRATGQRLACIVPAELRSLSSAPETAEITATAVVAGEVLVVALVVQEATQEYLAAGFDAHTGTLLWKTPLGRSPLDTSGRVACEAERGDDLVYVLPSWGTVIALEPLTGGVAWLRRYASERSNLPRNPVRRGRRVFEGVCTPPEWRRGFLALARGRLLVAPSDSSQLFALDPSTGEADWSVPDGKGRVLGAWGEGAVELEEGGAVKVVGKGKSDQRGRVPPRAAIETAAIAGDLLLLPLAGGSVHRIALRGARSEMQAVLPVGPAHLAAHGTHVIAAGVERVALLGEPGRAPRSFPSVESAARGLGDAEWSAREGATSKLAQLDALARPVLEEAARSADAERALRARGLLEALAAKERRARFAGALARARYSSPAALLDQLVGHDWRQRYTAVEALRQNRDKDPNLKPIFEELCADPEPQIDRSASLGALALGSRAGIQVVEKMASSPLLVERRVAFQALHAYGSADDHATFAKGLKDDDAEVRRTALLGALAKGDGRVAPALVGAIDNGAEIQRSSIVELAQMRKLEPSLAGPLLRRLYADEDPVARQRVVAACRQTVDRDARRTLVDALDDKDKRVRDDAFMALVLTLDREDPPDLPPGTIERLLVSSGARAEPVYRGTALLGARRLLEAGKPVRPAIFAWLAVEEEGGAFGVEALLGLARSVEVSPVDSADVAAIGSLARSASPVLRGKAYEAVFAARGPGRAALAVRGLADADEKVRALVEKRFGACDAEIVQEVLATEPPDARALAAVDGAEPLSVALGALAASESADERVRARGLARLQRLRGEIEKLAREVPDPAIRERLARALARSGR